MSIAGLLTHFGMKHLFDATSKEVVEWVDSRFEDSSRAVLGVIFDANGRAWNVVALALTERTLVSRVRDIAREADLKAARDEIRLLLASTPADQRARAAADLGTLHARYKAAFANAEGAETAETALRRFSDPSGAAAEADRAAGVVADSLADAPDLAAVLRLTPDGRTPLFQSFYRYYFWKLVRKNAELSALLTHDQLRALAATVDDRTAGILDQFDALFDALANLSQQVAGVDAKVGAGFGNVNVKLDTGLAGVDAANAKLEEIHRIVERVAARKKSTGLTECTEDELKELHAKLFELRSNSILVSAKQLEEIGDDLTEIELFDEARQVHTQAANVTTDTATESANHYKAYLDACSVANWTLALDSLKRAVEIDAPKYQPFPYDRYELVRVLGGGAFGTVFLCRDPSIDEPVAIKSLRAESLSGELDKLFKEAKTLHALKNANIIGIKDQWFADSAKTRPYFVLEYFDGETLDKLGVLSVADVIAIAIPAARALHAAHAAGVLHRDFKPANVMAKKEGDVWLVKVIDFGLALPKGARAKSMKTTQGKSVTGTQRYAPPEQTSDSKERVGAYSDVYAFGKTFLDVLFGTTAPKSWDWEEKLPVEVRKPLQNLLERCTVDSPLARREKDFENVLKTLTELQAELKAQEEELPTAELVEEEKPAPPKPAARPLVVSPTETRAQRYQRFKDQALQKNVDARLCVENCDFAEAVDVLEGFESEELLHRDESLLADAKNNRDRLADLNRKIEAALSGDKSLHDQLETLLTESLKLDPRNKDWRELHKTCEAERKQREAATEKATRERKAKEEAARLKAEEEAIAKDPFHPERVRTPGQTFRLKLPGDVPITFAWCPAGWFKMGGNAHDDEKPIHKVTLTKGFFMGIHPVTQAQWKAVMGTDPSHFKGENRPVESVTWHECAEFCTKITASLKGRVTVRLPTEAEWEYACRAGTTSEYWSGNDEAALKRVGWFSSTSKSETQPVGMLEKNPWGLYDVHGNVWEWCLDSKRTYTASDQTDPQGESNEDTRVLRGGSWCDDASYCRAASRYWDAPARRCNLCGFRVCFRLD